MSLWVDVPGASSALAAPLTEPTIPESITFYSKKLKNLFVSAVQCGRVGKALCRVRRGYPLLNHESRDHGSGRTPPLIIFYY